MESADEKLQKDYAILKQKYENLLESKKNRSATAYVQQIEELTTEYESKIQDISHSLRQKYEKELEKVVKERVEYLEKKHLEEITEIEKKNKSEMQQLLLKNLKDQSSKQDLLQLESILKQTNTKLAETEKKMIDAENYLIETEKKLNQEINYYKGQIDVAKADLKKEHSYDILKLEEKLSKAHQYKLNKVISQHQSEIKQLKSSNNSEITNSYETINFLRVELSEKDHEVTKLSKTVEQNLIQLELETRLKEKEIESRKSLEDKYLKEIKVLSEELAHAKLKEKSTGRVLQEKYMNELKSLKEDAQSSRVICRKLQEKLSNIEDVHNEELKTARKEIENEQQSKLKKLNHELSQLRKNEERQISEIESLSRSVSVFKKAAKTSESDLQANQEIIKLLQKEIDQLRSKSSFAKDDQQEIKILKSKFKGYVKQMQQHHNNLKDCLKKSSEKQSELKKQYSIDLKALRKEYNLVEEEARLLRESLKKNNNKDIAVLIDYYTKRSKKYNDHHLDKIEKLNERIERMAKGSGERKKQQEEPKARKNPYFDDETTLDRHDFDKRLGMVSKNRK